MEPVRISREDILDFAKEYRRNFINCLSGFKSLCLAGTADLQGRTNLSLISSVIHVGANPPLMGMLMRPHSVPRHTIENIDATGYFSLNHVTESMYRQAHQASARYPRNVSEFVAVGFKPAYSQLHPAPYVEAAPVKIGLALREKVTLKTNATVLIVGEILEVILPEAAVGADGFIDLQQTGSLTVSGLDAYYRATFIERLPYAKAPRPPKESPEEKKRD